MAINLQDILCAFPFIVLLLADMIQNGKSFLGGIIGIPACGAG